MSNRSAGGVLAAGKSLCEAAARGSLSQRRFFSISSTRQAHYVEFTQTSSRKLDNVLAAIQNKILLPSHLPLEQRKKLYSKKYEHKLRGDPITIEIDGEVTKFYHVDLFKDIPNTRQIAFEAIGMMRNKKDFENLPRLLEGLQNASRKLKPYDYTKMTRTAGDRGRIFTIIEAARMAKKTGFKLDNMQKVNEILTYVQLKAIDRNWDKEATEKALAWAEMVVDLLEEECHQRKRKHGEPDLGLFPLNRDPQILAARLHLAAALAVKHHDGQDVDGKVAKYARDLVGLWPAGTGLRQLHPQAAYTNPDEARHLLNDNKLLVVGSPILHGMDMAMQVLNPELAGELKSRRDAVAAEVQAALAVRDKGRGFDMYNKLFKPSEAAEGAV